MNEVSDQDERTQEKKGEKETEKITKIFVMNKACKVSVDDEDDQDPLAAVKEEDQEKDKGSRDHLVWLEPALRMKPSIITEPVISMEQAISMEPAISMEEEELAMNEMEPLTKEEEQNVEESYTIESAIKKEEQTIVEEFRIESSLKEEEYRMEVKEEVEHYGIESIFTG